MPAQTPEDRARRRAQYLSGLLWHAGVFVIINIFLWSLDVFMGAGGGQGSFWVTAAWGMALGFHALAYFIDGRGLEDRKTAQYLEEEARYREEERRRLKV